jgi:hypothetical protein
MSTSLTVYSFRGSRFNRTKMGVFFTYLVSMGGETPPTKQKITDH